MVGAGLGAGVVASVRRTKRLAEALLSDQRQHWRQWNLGDNPDVALLSPGGWLDEDVVAAPGRRGRPFVERIEGYATAPDRFVNTLRPMIIARYGGLAGLHEALGGADAAPVDKRELSRQLGSPRRFPFGPDRRVAEPIIKLFDQDEQAKLTSLYEASDGCARSVGLTPHAGAPPVPPSEAAATGALPSGAGTGSTDEGPSSPFSRHSVAPGGTMTGLTEPPPLVGPFLVRQGLQDQVVEGLLAQATTGGRAPMVALVGMGGSGKTVVAQAVAGDRRITSAFPDGVVWLSAGTRSSARCQAMLLAALEVPVVGDDVEAGLHALRRRLASVRCLVVIDDVTSNDQRVTLDVFGPGSAVLVTTRDHETVPHGWMKLLVEVLDAASALEMLAAYADVAEADLPGAAEEVLVRCGGLPLALAICGAMISDGQPWAGLASLLRKPRPDALVMTFQGYEHNSLPAAIEASTGGLPVATRNRYEDLAVFAGRGPVPVSVAALLWADHGLDSHDSQVTIMHLARRSLLTYRPDDATFLLHDLLYDYTLFRAADRLPGLHHRLALTFLQGWGGLDHGLVEAISRFAPPAQPADDDRYGLLHVAEHVVQAGRDDLLHRLLAAESGPDGRVNTWFAVHDQSQRMAEYLLALQLALGRARQATDQAASPADRAEGVALEIRYALIRSSIVSLAGTIPSGILVALVRHKIWTFNTARAYAEMSPDAQQRSAALRHLARSRGLTEHQRADLVELAGQAADAINFTMHRAFALVSLVGLAPTSLRETYLERALAAAGGNSQAEEIRAWLFRNVAKLMPDRALRELRAGASRPHHSARHYREAMTAALPQLPDLYEDVLAIARTDRFGNNKSKALCAVLLACESAQERRRLVKERLASFDPVKEKYFGWRIVLELAPYLDPDELRDLLDRTVDESNKFSTVAALAAAIPHLTDVERPARLEHAVEILRTGEVSLQREEIVPLLHLVSEPELTQLLEELFDGMLRERPSSAVWAACRIAPFMSEDLLRRVLDHTGSANPPEDALNELAPHLTPSLLEYFLATRRLDEKEPWAQALVHLAPDQPSETLRRVVRLVATVADGPARVSLLTALAPHLPGTLTADAVAAIPDDTNPELQARLLALLAATATAPDRDALLCQAHDLAATTDHPHHRYRSLIEPATDPRQLSAALHLQCVLDRDAHHREPPHDPIPLPDELITRATRLVQATHGPCGLAHSLASLIPYAAPDRRAVLLRDAAMAALTPHDHIDDVPCDGLRALQRTAGHVPDEARLLLPDRDIAARLVTDNPVEWMRQLSCLLASLPVSRRYDIAEQALDCLTTMSPSWDVSWISRHGVVGLTTIAPYLTFEGRRRAVELAYSLESTYQTTDALAVLAAHADPAARPWFVHEALAYLRTCTHAYELDGLLKTRPSCLDDVQAAELLDRLLHAVDRDRGGHHGFFPETISSIAPYLTPALLDRAATAVKQHPTASERARASKALAHAADTTHPEPWSSYWRTALSDATTNGRLELLSLIADLPLHHRQQRGTHLIQAILDTRRWWPADKGH